MIEELLSNSVAAQTLSELLPEKSSEQWALWLQNNRNQARRVSYRIPFGRMAGGVFYNREEIAKFAEWEKMRQVGTMKLTGRAAEVMQAIGFGTTNGSMTGRKLKITSINLQVDQATGRLYIQIITDEPLTIYRVEIAEAKNIVKELNEIIGVCERIEK